jgi:hypothetical protein
MTIGVAIIVVAMMYFIDKQHIGHYDVVLTLRTPDLTRQDVPACVSMCPRVLIYFDFLRCFQPQAGRVARP